MAELERDRKEGCIRRAVPILGGKLPRRGLFIFFLFFKAYIFNRQSGN